MSAKEAEFGYNEVNRNFVLKEKKVQRLKRRRPILALLLSLVQLGLGQMYNGQLRKGVLLYIAGLLLTAILSFTGLFSRFYGMIFCLAILLSFLLFVLLDALFSAVRLREIELKPYNKWYLYILIILLHVFVIVPIIKDNIIPFKTYKMPSGAMEPALMIGDQFVVKLDYYKNKMPQRGDMVVFPYPRDPSIKYVKRVIGLEGERIKIRDKKVFINGKKIQEPGVVHNDTKILPNSPRDNYGPITIPKGSVFVMGDNRDNSADSRYYGSILVEQIKGKVLYIHWAKDKKRIGIEFE